MADLHTTVPMSAVTKNITLQVTTTGVQTFRARLWLAIKVLKLAAWIAGVGIVIDGHTGSNRDKSGQ